MRGLDRTALTAIAVGALVGLGSTSAQAGGYFIVDDFNTTNLYELEVTQAQGAQSTQTPIDAGNIVWGIAGGGLGITRSISAQSFGPDSVTTQICATCQAGHGISGGGSTGNFDFSYTGPSVAVKAINFHFLWAADQSGADIRVTFDRAGFQDYIVELDDLPNTGSSGVNNLVPVWIELDPTNDVFDDLESVRIDVFGVADLDFSIDDIHIAAPAPATLALFGFALAGLGLARRRKA